MGYSKGKEQKERADMDRQTPEKKKRFYMMQPVRDFMRDQSGDAKQELNGIIWKLETEGALSMPYAEKLDGENLFAIRVIQAANIRVFYVYGVKDLVFGIHGYTKKTEQIPDCERRKAERMVKLLRQRGAIK